ncbi:hypothetical protein [Bacterioplanoides sp.]|uniref:hypothetical protein n=1 Tax=Bacterioplanoides sp. TaxID=2066072 RepID=UPI003AFF8D22
MRLLIFFLAYVGCYSSSSAEYSNDIIRAISYGKISELNNIETNHEKKLFLRLISLPEKGSCIEETLSVCSYKHFISVSSFDEYPDFNIFLLSYNGFFDEVVWKNSGNIDEEIVEVNYQGKKRVLITISPDNVDEEIYDCE